MNVYASEEYTVLDKKVKNNSRKDKETWIKQKNRRGRNSSLTK
jgi:hypothetical protein